MTPIEQKHNPESNEEKSLCCGRPWAKSVSNTKGTRKVCSNCGTPHSETDALLKSQVCPPTPVEGKVCGELLGTSPNYKTGGELPIPCGNIKPCHLHPSPTPDVGEEWVRELRCRLDGYRVCSEDYLEINTQETEVFIRELLSQREARVRGETIAECVKMVSEETPEHYTREYRDTDLMRDKINKRLQDFNLQALQSLSPNQK